MISNTADMPTLHQ